MASRMQPPEPFRVDPETCEACGRPVEGLRRDKALDPDWPGPAVRLVPLPGWYVEPCGHLVTWEFVVSAPHLPA